MHSERHTPHRHPSIEQGELAYATNHLRRGTTAIQTHRHVDVDAAFSVALWAHLIGKDLSHCTLCFNGSTLNGNEEFIGIDVHGGIKGRRSSAFEELGALLNEVDKIALRDLTAHITAEDQAKLSSLSPEARVGMLSTVIDRKHLSGESDTDICLWAESILHTFLISGKEVSRVEQVAARAQSFCGGRIQLIDSDEYLPQEILFQRGAHFVVYDYYNNVGVKRSPAINDPHLGKLLADTPGTEDFYSERNGFLFCSGSKKAPARVRPPISGVELAQVLASLIQN